jgi:hypothetical protein
LCAVRMSRVAGGAVYGYTENKDSYLLRLRRIEGQVRGLQRMGRPCPPLRLR